ncbi:MAG: DUF6503 family protein, partial [Bacteroidota bacterium]
MKYFPIILFFFLLACQPAQQSTEKSTPVASTDFDDHHIPSITKVFDAHGGYDAWRKMKMLSYNKGEEKTLTDLENRKIQLTNPTQTIGFDGTDVWVTPDSVDASRARFYHNLFFYFYAMPFVLGDPGIFYEDLAPKELLGKEYKGIKIAYGDGIGDSPKDNYIIWYDPDTYRMEWLMYT